MPTKAQKALILSIETSCDETAISIVEVRRSGIKVLADTVISQIEIHKPYGGVFPMLAKREHKKNLPILLEKALKDWGSKDKKKIDALAVTYGPGLEPALWEGITFAQGLGKSWGKPVIPINHMEGHVVAGLLHGSENLSASRLYPQAGSDAARHPNFPSRSLKIQNPKFPALALLISGGHTELVLMEDWFKYKIVGETRDDAVGEAFDKAARILGLPYPGGPEISKLAEKFRATRNQKLETSYQLPRPMLHSKDFDFSFSGLKTAVLYMVQKIPKLTDKIRQEIAYEFEESATEVLLAKTLAAAKQHGARSIILGGGVSANIHIQKTFREHFKKNQKGVSDLSSIKLFLPEKKLTTDNALMIALAAGLRILHGKAKMPKDFRAEGNLRLE